MQLANLTMIPKHKLIGLALLLIPALSFAQENSPYSRYGIGNLSPQGNILTRGMGGISASFSDYSTVNFVNPASYGDIRRVTLDIALEIASRTLLQQSPVSKFTSNYATVPYLSVGIPLFNPSSHPTNKYAKKGISWAAAFGLRPVSRINYKIENDGRLAGIDSLITTYEGNGGVNEAFIGTGVKIRKFSFGFNTGYLFGTKDYSTKIEFQNDTANYIKSNSQTKTTFAGVFVNAGMQYTDTFSKGTILKIGAYGNLSQNYHASQDLTRETFYFTTTGSQTPLDSVYKLKGQTGKIKLPASYGIGFSLEGTHILAGIDFESTTWTNYRFYDQADYLQNSWMLRGGFQFHPAGRTSKKYIDFVKYRAGVFYGQDYVSVDGKLPVYGVTAGLGLPLKLKRNFYETQYSVLNIALEYGSRGTKTSNNITENIFRLSFGFTFSDLWFRRYKYD